MAFNTVTTFNEHTYYYTIVDEYNNKFTGKATCHPDDYDIESQRIGYDIASQRALIKILTHKKNYEIKTTLKSYEHLYDSMSHSKYFNPKSFEARRIRSTIKNLQEDYQAYKEEIAEMRKLLRIYIEQIDHYKKGKKN